MNDERLDCHGGPLGKTKLEQKQIMATLLQCSASPLDGPKAHANKRLYTCQLAVTIWPHNPHHTLARVCNGDQVSPLLWLSLAVSIQQSSAPVGDILAHQQDVTYEGDGRFTENVQVSNENNGPGVVKN